MAFDPQSLGKGIGVVESVVRATKGLICIGRTIFSFLNPSNLLAGIGMFAAGIGNSIANAVLNQVNDHISETLGLLSLPVQALQSYVDSLQRSVTNLLRLYEKVEKRGQDLLDYLLDTQNCAVMGANFLNCLFKALMNKVDQKVTNKLIKGVDGVFGKLQSDLKQEVLRTGGLLDKHVGQQTQRFEILTRKLNALL